MKEFCRLVKIGQRYRHIAQWSLIDSWASIRERTNWHVTPTFWSRRDALCCVPPTFWGRRC